MIRPLVIFDIDGTISDPAHRLHHLEGIKTGKDSKVCWDNFLAHAMHDPVIEQGRILYDAIRYKKDTPSTTLDGYSYNLGFVTSRNSMMRDLTETWLHANDFVDYEFVIMREIGDMRPDYLVKEDLLLNLIIPKYGKPIMAVEDNHDVIDHCWLKHGIYAVDVSQRKQTFMIKHPSEA